MQRSDSSLGPLQQLVLELVWQQPESSVRSLRDSLHSRGLDYAYTTIQTVCDALYRKQMVKRRRRGSAFMYSARQSQAGLFVTRLRELLSGLSCDPQPVASSLVDALELEAPDQLEALIAELRQRGRV